MPKNALPISNALSSASKRLIISWIWLIGVMVLLRSRNPHTARSIGNHLTPHTFRDVCHGEGVPRNGGIRDFRRLACTRKLGQKRIARTVHIWASWFTSLHMIFVKRFQMIRILALTKSAIPPIK